MCHKDVFPHAMRPQPSHPPTRHASWLFFQVSASNAAIGGPKRAPASELLDAEIAALEASLGLQPGEAVEGTATASEAEGGGAAARGSAKPPARENARNTRGGGKKGGKG